MIASALAQSPAPGSTGTGDPVVAFRGANPSIKGVDTGGAPNTDAATLGETQEEMDSLAEQKETLESELRYARSKLEAARGRLDVESMAGHAEQADQMQQEVTDWQARVRTLQSQLAQVDGEVQGAIQQMQPPEPENTLILPGETLEIFVVEDASFNGRYEVRRGGYIIMPAVGRIAVAGRTLQAAEAAVRKALESNQLQHATVMVEKVEGLDAQSGPVIYLAGEFKKTGPFPIPLGTKVTVVSVIISVGITDKADLSRVRVMRVAGGKNVVEEENVQRIFEGTGLASDLTLENGDVVMIPAGSANVVYITGRVLHPCSLPLRPGDKLSAYSAILQSGGFASFADLKKVYVLRPAPDGTRARIDVNVVAIQRGQAADIPLLGGDIIIVPEKFFSF